MASACSCANCDVLVDAPIIVGGWIADWQEYGANPQVPPGFTAITTAIDVAEVFKGAPPARVEVIDPASRTTLPPGWLGASGACGKFDADPTGKYIILGLDQFEHDPALMAGSRIWLIYMGDGPEGEAYEQALARLSPLGPPSPPAAGNTTTPPGGELPVLALTLLAISATLTALTLVRRR